MVLWIVSGSEVVASKYEYSDFRSASYARPTKSVRLANTLRQLQSTALRSSKCRGRQTSLYSISRANTIPLANIQVISVCVIRDNTTTRAIETPITLSSISKCRLEYWHRLTMFRGQTRPIEPIDASSRSRESISLEVADKQ